MNEEESIPTRDCSDLHCQIETWTCACNGCIPCAYKIGNFDVALDRAFSQLVPNQRPEQCPRIQNRPISAAPQGTLGYQQGMNVMTIGDGDMSFSLALARLLYSSAEASTSRLVATSYESKESLLRVYPTVESTLKELDRLGAQVMFGVDAIQLPRALGQFDRIIWNFPCTAISRGQDGQNDAMEDNKQLVRKFARNAKSFLRRNGEIHMAHKTKPPFNQWNIQDLVVAPENSDYVYKQRVVLDRATLPPYTPRKALDRKSFPVHDACFYMFLYVNGADDRITSRPTNLLPVTKDRILYLRTKLRERARHTSANKHRAKKRR